MDDIFSAGFADIHTHIMFGVDDGAKSFEAAAEMLEAAYNSGTRVICLTSHYKPQAYGETPTPYENGFEELCEYARSKLPGLELYLGNELFLHYEADRNLIDGKCRSLNGTRYVLAEAYPRVEFRILQASLLRLTSVGYIPVLAHAERYDCLEKEKNAAALREAGVLFQANADAVLGKCGRRAAGRVKRMMRKGYVWVIASDAHDSTEFTPVLSQCWKYVKKKYGNETAERLFIKNPRIALGIYNN